MRETKFKAWDKRQKKWVDNEITIDNGGFRNIVDLDSNIATESDVEIIWFTNLKDKNEKEIYEGYIVNFEFKDSSNNGLIGKGVIVWMEHESGWGIEEIGNTFFNIKFVKEIIGNIYENPELLEVEK